MEITRSLTCSLCGRKSINGISQGRHFRARQLSTTKAQQREEQGPSSEQGGGPPPSWSGPVETVAWGGTLPRQRRAILGGLTAVGIGLVGNLGGISSGLLGLDGGSLAGSLRLDVVYPVGGLMRCVDFEKRFEFQYPATWLADQSLVRRAAERFEQQSGLDLPPLSARRRSGTEPTAAFGPAGSTGEENVSVIVSPIGPDFRIDSLGTPEEAGQRFMSQTVAPPGSGREAELLSASSRVGALGEEYYSLEFTVRSPEFRRHNCSVFCARKGQLFTFLAMCPESRWDADSAILRQSVASFRIFE